MIELNEKQQLRQDLLSDMYSASYMLKVYQMVLDSAETNQLSYQTIAKVEDLMSFEQTLLRRARNNMNKLRRGQL